MENFPKTDYCSESYLEFRKFNATEQLIGRFCETKLIKKNLEVY